LETYREIKKLYDIRSKIVHGNVKPKRGVINWRTSAIDAKGSNISIDDYRKIKDFTARVLRAVVSDKAIVNVIQTKTKDDDGGGPHPLDRKRGELRETPAGYKFPLPV
jgi:hypothetical protein